MSDFPNISAVTKRKIPYLGRIACGKPVFADEEKGVYFDVCSDLKIDFCLKAKGDSMINARIQDGDIVFIREQAMVNKPLNGSDTLIFRQHSIITSAFPTTSSESTWRKSIKKVHNLYIKMTSKLPKRHKKIPLNSRF